MKDAASRMKDKVGVLVLAKASMKNLAKAIEDIAGAHALTSASLAMDAFVKRVRS